MLLGIRVRNYEMLRDTKVGIVGDEVLTPPSDIDLALAAGVNPAIRISSLSALIGRNDTGKSSLFHAMSFLSDAVRHGARFASTQQGRKGFTRLRSNGGLDLVAFDLAVHLVALDETVLYHVAFDCDLHGRPYVQEEDISLVDKTGARIMPLLHLEKGHGVLTDNGTESEAGVGSVDITGLGAYGSILSHPCIQGLYSMITRWLFCSFLPHDDAREPAAALPAGGHRHLTRDGANVENVLMYFRQEDTDFFERSINRIREKMPGRRRIDDAVLDGRVSAASRRLFTYLLLFEDPNPRPLICIENPDEGLHHEMVDTLAAELRDYSLRRSDTQVLFTTHNPHMLEAMSPEEVWVFERKPLKMAEATVDNAEVRCAGADPVVKAMYDEGIGMGSLWYSGHFEQEEFDAP